MLPKPATCLGCPLYGDGKGFVPDETVPNSTVFVLGQGPGGDEEREGRPFVGRTGRELNSVYLPLAGLEREAVSVGNTIRCRWRHTNTLPPARILDAAVTHCRCHDAVPDTVRLVIAHGALAWKMTQGSGFSITNWRGFLGEMKWGGIPVYATLHTADLFRDRKMMPVARLDWKKVPKILNGTWPRTIPKPVVVGRGSDDGQDELPERVEGTIQRSIYHASRADYLAIDTEFTNTGLLTLLGVGWRSPDGTPDGLQLEWLRRDVTTESRRQVVRGLSELVSGGDRRVVFHNALADLPVLRDSLGITIPAGAVDDTMLAHACLWSELPHDLEFIASVYGKYHKLKHLAGTNNLAYNWGDILATLDAWQALKVGLEADKGALDDYQQQRLKLIPIIQEAHEHGIRVNTPQVEAAYTAYTNRRTEASRLGAAWCGWPINLGSSEQLTRWLYRVEGYPVQQNRATKRPSVDNDAIAALRVRQRSGTTVDGVVFWDDRLRDVVEEDWDWLLEARWAYAESQQTLSHYLIPLRGADRIYPRFAIHAQANRRWSTTDPPLAQLPEDLRDIIRPDDGYVWIGWDWQQIEPRLMMGYAKSRFLQSVFEKGWDIHTIGLCDVMGWGYPNNLCYPETDQAWVETHQWQGPGDKRRRLAKVIRYKKYYGGDDAAYIPGIHLLGLTRNRLRVAGDLILRSDPDLVIWMAKTAASVAKRPIVRDFLGCRRVLMASTGRAAAREAYNFPMQSGVQSIANLTAIEIKKRLPQAVYAWGMHDSQYWQVPAEQAEACLAVIKPIVEQTRNIEGTAISFPALFKVINP